MDDETDARASIARPRPPREHPPMPRQSMYNSKARGKVCFVL
jgi:hypothetical protein